jgi:flagellar assembly protein FliH
LSNRIKSGEIQIGSNYVLPIEQTKVTAQQAKVKKIIAETDAKAQQIISAADNKSQVIVQTANNEASRIIEDARKKGEQEFEIIKQQAYQDGFVKGERDGFTKFQNDAAEALKSLEILASSTFDIKRNIIDSATLDIVELVSAIADKVCHVKFDDEVLKQITIDAIKQLNDKENITIIVNPELVDNINSMSESFREEITKIQSIKIIEDNSVSPDGVIVETLNTRLDSRVSTQISEIAQKMLTGANDELE